METDDWLRIIIAFNEPEKGSGGDPDSISEADVVDEAEAVRASLLELGHKAETLPVSNPSDALREVLASKPDLVFNLCEGLNGDSHMEMNMAALWELAGIPFTGNRPLTLGLAQNKILAKRLFEAKGILTPRWMECASVPDSCPLRFPVIAKPACEDASLGISADGVATDLERLRRLVAKLLGKYGSSGVLVEEFVDGREFNVSILGNNPPKALPVSEIDFGQLDKDTPKITSYEAKWLEENPLYRKTPSVCPANIDSAAEERLRKTALDVYSCLLGKDYGRVDMRMDSKGDIYVLEYNPNPCISPDAGFAKALAAAGMAYKDFVAAMISENLKAKSEVA